MRQKVDEMGDTTQNNPANSEQNGNGTQAGADINDQKHHEESSENGKKYVELSRHKEKLGKVESELEATRKERDELLAAREEQERSKMSELDLLKSDNEKLQKQIKDLSFSQRKQEALAKAKRNLGEGKTITPENEERINKLLGKLNTSEDTLEDDVADLVSGWATSITNKQPDGMVVGKAARIDNDKDPLDYTPAELDKIQRENPEKYEKIRAARKQGKRQKSGD